MRSDRLIALENAAPIFRRRGLRSVGRLLERVLALHEINRIHVATRDVHDPSDFLREVLAGFGVRYDVRPEELLRIPANGPVVVVSNHPFGGLDAIILAAVLRGVRPDARILANYLLGRLPQVAEFILPVDPFGGPDAARRNVQGMQRALAHLQGGGLLGAFPSGTVSHFRLRRMAVEDPAWSTHLFRLIQRSRATVVPVFFPGRNSIRFQAAGFVHPLLRTALIPREAVRRRGDTVRLVIGRPIPPARLERFDDAARCTQFLRMQTYVLASAAEEATKRATVTASGESLAPTEDPAVLAAEVATLPAADVLVRDGDFIVAVARAQRDVALVREIGRLREETFRAAGEGTGRARDLDAFDQHYLHLFWWDQKEQRVGGGYRIARVDRVLAERGRDGLYTATLFKFRSRFLENLGPSFELGRSWIHPDYQRRYNALALLWRGIGALVVREPECALLLGPVSISRDYLPLSRGLIVSFLKHTRLDRRLAAFVRPARPYRLPGRIAQLARDVGSAARTIEDVSLFVSLIEADGKGVPVLFRHYLKLHSTVLSFNVDPQFADVVDGLLLADLRQSDPNFVRRFLGAPGYAKFASHHGIVEAPDIGGRVAAAAAKR
jgi:putative hemolysin